MGKLTIIYNGDENLPLDRNHMTMHGRHQCSRLFTNVDDALMFWLECEFYSGAITKLDDFYPAGKYSEILELMRQEVSTPQELQLDSQKVLYELDTEQGLDSYL